jgi:hypothetical protein
VDLVEVASTCTDRLFCFVAECRSECTEHARAPVGARRATQGDDDRARTEPCTARTASPSPVEVAVNGASVPRGRVCSPQVFGGLDHAVAAAQEDRFDVGEGDSEDCVGLAVKPAARG